MRKKHSGYKEHYVLYTSNIGYIEYIFYIESHQKSFSQKFI